MYHDFRIAVHCLPSPPSQNCLIILDGAMVLSRVGLDQNIETHGSISRFDFDLSVVLFFFPLPLSPSDFFISFLSLYFFFFWQFVSGSRAMMCIVYQDVPPRIFKYLDVNWVKKEHCSSMQALYHLFIIQSKLSAPCLYIGYLSLPGVQSIGEFFFDPP